MQVDPGIAGGAGALWGAWFGFDAGDLERGGLVEALKGDPVIRIAGGHTHAGTEAAVLDLAALEAEVAALGPQVIGDGVVVLELTAEYIGMAFANAGSDLWFNVKAVFGPEHARWEGLIQFWHEIYVPYFIGALIPGGQWGPTLLLVALVLASR